MQALCQSVPKLLQKSPGRKRYPCTSFGTVGAAIALGRDLVRLVQDLVQLALQVVRERRAQHLTVELA